MDSLIVENGEFKLKIKKKGDKTFLSITHIMKHGQLTSAIWLNPKDVDELIKNLK